jgi:hypothetical protein
MEFFPAGAAVAAAFFYHFHSIPFFNQQNKFNFFSSGCCIFTSFLHLPDREVKIFLYFFYKLLCKISSFLDLYK